jgi:hypothetical protein
MKLSFDPTIIQYGKLNRPFRLYSISKKDSTKSRFIGGVEKWEWVAEFKYLDEQGGTFKIEIDNQDEIKKI